MAITYCVWRDYALMVIGALLVMLSVFGAFETPTVQACIPQMLAGDNIIKGNAVVNQVASISYLTAPLLGGILYAAFGLKPVMYASVGCFFVMGVTMVGIPFIVRTILGLDATYYGGAESALAVATILGSIAAGFLTGRLKVERLSLELAAIGICIIPAGGGISFPA